jgi:hypothetical protein
MTIETFPITTLGSAAASVVSKLSPPKRKPFEPGVYFNLRDDLYHADLSLGSTDMKTLADSPPDYWFGSGHNPLREDKDPTPAQKFGSAIHKFVLEGRQAFEAQYAPTEYPGNVKAGKDERAAIIDAGKQPISRDDWNRIMMAGTIIKSNPEISDAFSGGCPEVSIFWERDGIKRKGRFDYLKTRAVVDLKSNSNQFRENFVTSCRKSIGKFRYDMQAAHYNEGRAILPKLVAEGRVFGDHYPEWLRRVCAAEQWAFVWIFYQSEGAPLTWGATLSPGNGLFDLASASLAKAEENYRRFASDFGFEKPWVLSEPLEEIDVNDIPAWAFK